MTEVAHEAAAEKAQEILHRRAVVDEDDGCFRQSHDQVVRVDVVRAKHVITVADSLEDGQPRLFAVLDLRFKCIND